jgi:hypothetical protein
MHRRPVSVATKTVLARETQQPRLLGQAPQALEHRPTPKLSGAIYLCMRHISTRTYHKNNIISSVMTIWSDNDKDFIEVQK